MQTKLKQNNFGYALDELVKHLLHARTTDGDHRICPVWRPAGLPEEEPGTQRHLLQGPGC